MSCVVYLSVFILQTAGYYTSSRGPEASYYGLHATMDVYGHELKHGQWSSTTFWVSHYGDGNKSSYNEIQVGWHVRIIFLSLPIHIASQFK